MTTPTPVFGGYARISTFNARLQSESNSSGPSFPSKGLPSFATNGKLKVVLIEGADRSVPTCPKNCDGQKEFCYIKGGDCKCYKHDGSDDVGLYVKVIGSWVDGRDGKPYVQYEYTIKNYSKRDIQDIYLRSTKPLRVRDHDIWNIVRLPNNYLTLPYYQNSINSHASYTFGFILQGYEKPVINIVYIKY